MLTTHIYAGFMHSRSLLCSGPVIDNFFQMPARAGNCLLVLRFVVSQTDGREGRGVEMEDPDGAVVVCGLCMRSASKSG